MDKPRCRKCEAELRWQGEYCICGCRYAPPDALTGGDFASAAWLSLWLPFNHVVDYVLWLAGTALWRRRQWQNRIAAARAGRLEAAREAWSEEREADQLRLAIAMGEPGSGQVRGLEPDQSPERSARLLRGEFGRDSRV